MATRYFYRVFIKSLTYKITGKAYLYLTGHIRCFDKILACESPAIWVLRMWWQSTIHVHAHHVHHHLLERKTGSRGQHIITKMYQFIQLVSLLSGTFDTYISLMLFEVLLKITEIIKQLYANHMEIITYTSKYSGFYSIWPYFIHPYTFLDVDIFGFKE